MTNPSSDRDPGSILHALGIDVNATISPLDGGWSGSTVFRVIPEDSGEETLVLRILPGRRSGPEREAAIHQVVRNHGIPAPAIVAIGPIAEGADGTAMVMPFMPGIPLNEILLRMPPDAATAPAWGDVCGAMLARIHAILPAALSDIDVPSWLTWVPPSHAVMPVLDRWLTNPACDPANVRLLHLDYHPANLLGDAGTKTISAVLDWTNARLGPPVADVARTRSILRLVAATDLPPAAQSALSAFEHSFQTAWERHHGPVDPAMLRAFDAWALDVQLADLAPKRTMPNTWVTETLLTTLRDARDAAIAASLDDQ